MLKFSSSSKTIESDLCVAKLIRGHVKVSVQLLELLVIQLLAYVCKRRRHCPEPGAARFLGDAKGNVTHPQSRMTAFLLVRPRTTPVLDEKESQMMSRLAQVLGVHGTQRRVEFDHVIERIHQLDEKGITADLFVERCSHPTTLTAAPRINLPVS